MYRGASVSVSSDVPFPIHIDGEYLGRRETPLHLKIIPRVLPVLALREGRVATKFELERLLA
jgi:diacylglycerol kinase family enzyme